MRNATTGQAQTTTMQGHATPRADRRFVVSSRIRDRRHALRMTQNHVVAKLAALGVRSTNRSLSGLEHGVGIDVCKLPEIAAALDCTVTYLLGLTDDADSWQPDPPVTWTTAALPLVGPASPPDEDPRSANESPVGRILGPCVPDH